MAPLGPRQSPLRGSKEKDSRDYAWAIASSRGYAHPWDMDFFAAESALRQSANNAWMAPPLPAAVPAAFNNGPSLSGLDQFAFQQSPPLLYTSLTRPAPPEQANSVLQVEEDAAFRVWVQQVPPADTLAAVLDTVP
ncbi:unnamed protein product [Symbiodinium natans]|uniref:Uncharacterized protein n=1 Tax=Symbiodinium natans TaxID=878477 RepID=A0A812MXD6_9DINO|nr:unnamed protein product [Symbiodinium natans]